MDHTARGRLSTTDNLLCGVTPMSEQLAMHDLVALLEDAPAEHFGTGRPLLLRRGQIGTVVMAYKEAVFEV